MTTLQRSHTVYIKSSNRNSGTSSNYDIILPTFITNDPNLDLFKITLQSFSVYNSTYLVNDGANSITIDGIPVHLPNGTYTYQRLAKVLQQYTGATVTWDQDTNEIEFTFNISRTITFDGLGTLLGFEPETTYTGITIKSDKAMTPYDNTHIFVHLNNICPVNNNMNFSNMDGEVRQSSILSKILINAPPFQLITFQQLLESDGLWSADNSIERLEFVFTDMNGVELEGLPEHELTIRIESYTMSDVKMKDLLKEIKEIKTILKDLFLSKYLKNRGLQ